MRPIDREAVEWLSHRNRWKMLFARARKNATPYTANKLAVPLLYWPTVSRLVVMEEPSFIEHIDFKYMHALDEQGSTTELCMIYRSITGKQPRVRSWRHV